MKLNKLLKDLKTERVQGSSAVLNYSNFDYWVNWDDMVEIVENHKQPSLNENQQVVLEWLKEAHKIGWHVLELFDTLLNRNYIGFDEKEHSKMDKIRTAILALSEAELFQVLAAFAEWGIKEVAE